MARYPWPQTSCPWAVISLATSGLRSREAIAKTVASLEKTTGERPVGWFTRYGPSLNTRDLVVDEGGFIYDSAGLNDDLPSRRPLP